MGEPRSLPQSSRKFARGQRRQMTRAEATLWRALRGHRLEGHKFRRQTPIGPYFADFVCLERKVIVEADGRTRESEDAILRDAERDAWLRRQGYRVLRFADDLIIGGLPIVIERIRAALAA
ncbi:MAG: endonuclease domain-containing protein [Roseiarcus sp.]|jgi:very-short-patch-repair endonuclease|uniref:endonuclease domain-containing protein n=1 Tax=Roseiarcus sp. TaxID=1969460 RepID=UPI003C1AA32C